MTTETRTTETIQVWLDTLDDDAREFFTERAAIVEYDAGQPREAAEAVAQRLTLIYLQRREPRHGTD
jgi:hypothetical protein